MKQVFNRLNVPHKWANKTNSLIDFCHNKSRKNALRLNVMADKQNTIERFDDQKFSLLTALAYPRADEERISIINDFHSYLFFNDDIAEQDEKIGKCLNKLVPIFLGQIRALREGIVDDPNEPLCAYLLDIRQRLIKIASHRWLNRFMRNVEDYLLKGTLVGAQNWMFGKVPTLQQYEEQRKYDSSVFACQDLIEISEKFELPGEIFYHHEIQSLKELSNLVVAYTNDIFSYHKEVMVFSSPNNIIHVMMTHKGVPFSTAVDMVVNVINEKVEAFIQLEKNRSHWGDIEEKMVNRYLEGQKSWMRGNIDWSISSRRYHSPQSPFEELRQEPEDAQECLLDASGWR